MWTARGPRDAVDQMSAAHIPTPSAAATTAPSSCRHLPDELPLECCWRKVAERRVATMGVVEPLDVVEDRRPRLRMTPESLPIQQLTFQRGEARLGDDIVVTIAHR